VTINPRVRAAVAAVALEAELAYPPKLLTWPSAEGLQHLGDAQVTRLAQRLDMDADELVDFARHSVDRAIRITIDRHRLDLEEPTIQLVVELATGTVPVRSPSRRATSLTRCRRRRAAADSPPARTG